MSDVVVVGANGRVARAILPVLESMGVRVRLATRGARDDELIDLARGATAVLNLAGRAHLARGTAPDLEELRAANVELPLRLHRIATTANVPLVHLSSTKAGVNDDTANPYARSKAQAELLLAEAAASPGGAPVVAFRTCAVMAPPYDAGKLSLLRHFTWLPAPLIPARRVPVVSAEELARLLRAELDTSRDTPFTVVEVPAGSRMSLRAVVVALRGQR